MNEVPFSAKFSHGGRAEIAPKAPFLGQLAPFRPSPRLLRLLSDLPVGQKRHLDVAVQKLPRDNFVSQLLAKKIKAACDAAGPYGESKRLLWERFCRGCRQTFFFEPLTFSDSTKTQEELKKMLVWPPLQRLAVKKTFILCKFWAVKNFKTLVEKCR